MAQGLQYKGDLYFTSQPAPHKPMWDSKQLDAGQKLARLLYSQQ